MTYSTPLYGIPVPDGTSLAKNLPAELKAMGEGFEAALNAHVAIPVSNAAVVTATSAAARDSYWGTPTTETARLTLQARGATTIRTDKNITERFFATYDSTSNPQGMTPAGWYPIGAPSSLIPTTRSAAERDAIFGTPSTSATQIELQNRGARTYRADLGVTEQYFAAFHATSNPNGRTTAGWVEGSRGQVIGFSKSELSINLATTSTSWTDATGYLISYTPKNANSILKITAEFRGLSYLAGGSNIGGNYAITDSANTVLKDASWGYYDGAGAERNVSGRYVVIAYVAAANVSTRTYKMRYKTFATRTQIGDDGTTSLFTIEEIGQ